MLNLRKEDVSLDPFPHIVSKEILDPSFYARLRSDYPTADIFESQKANIGLAGSRTNQGFDIYREDDAYATLLSKSSAWREFDAYINSKRFIELFLELFGKQLTSFGCRLNISPDAYDRGFLEPRQMMGDKPTFTDNLIELGKRFLPTSQKKSSATLFTRLDIHKALTGYQKSVHCDRPNRLCSLIVYFCDADKIGLQGGELTIHKHNKTKRFEDYERHPSPTDAPTVRTLKPKENLGILFPCCNNSYHGVTAVQSSGIERDYLYINISAKERWLW